jgi:CheY-like chemotaxis protein
LQKLLEFQQLQRFSFAQSLREASNCKLAYKILEVKSCLAKTQANKDFNMYDSIYMDFMMPDMNGPEVTTVLRKMGYVNVNTVVGLTTNFMSELK